MASRTPAEVTQDILTKLSVTAPGLSLEIGTPERKIVEAVAEAIAEAQVDNYLVSNQLDVNSKSGQDLEDFVGLFGFGRLQGHYASGVLTVTLTNAATSPMLIPVGTQFSTSPDSTNSSSSFVSTTAVTLNKGSKTVSVPVQCTVVGSAGNVAANTVTTYAAGLGIASVTNSAAMVGGTDDETDDELRARFKKTILRNITGTEDFYIGMAMQVDGVKRVNVMGPVSTYQTQVQSTGGSITIPAKDCKYVWPQGVLVASNKGASNELWYTEGADYTVTSSGSVSAPVLNVSASIIISPATSIFLDVIFDYCSTNSRNDPASGIANKVDIFVDGLTPITITEKIVTASKTTSSTTSNTYYTGNFKSPTGETIAASKKFQAFGSTPILTWPSTIAAGGTTYTLGTDYFGVFSTTPDAGSERELAGIVWINTPPSDGTLITATYTYNQTPTILNSLINKAKQVTTDVLVHSATTTFLRFYFVVMYNQGATISTVNAQAVTAMQDYINGLPFGAWIQLSDLLTVIHNIPGIDNVRMAKTSDGAPFTVSEMLNGASTGTTYTSDFQLHDIAIPALDLPADINTLFIRRTFNNFGS